MNYAQDLNLVSLHRHQLLRIQHDVVAVRPLSRVVHSLWMLGALTNSSLTNRTTKSACTGVALATRRTLVLILGQSR